MKIKKLSAFLLCFVVLLCSLPFASAQNTAMFDAAEKAGSYLREEMKSHSARVEFSVPVSENSLGNLQTIATDFKDAVYAEVFRHTGAPDEGDYLKYTYDTYHLDVNLSQDNKGQYYLDYYYDITYRITAAQEKELTEKLNALVPSLTSGCKNDYEKVRAIYGWIKDNVTYDRKNLNDSSNIIKYTAYAAAVNGTAVCMGYAMLFERMCLSAGVDCRFIGGYSKDPITGTDMSHGWNIVKLGGIYYYADCTWDDSLNSETYFLKGSENFPNHYAGDEFKTEEFAASATDFDLSAYLAAPPEESTTTPAEVTTRAEETTTTPPETTTAPAETTTLPAETTTAEENTTKPAQAAKRGDTDSNGIITVRDARFVLRVAILLEKVEKGSALYDICDADADGNVTVSDARKILRVAINLEQM